VAAKLGSVVAVAITVLLLRYQTPFYESLSKDHREDLKAWSAARTGIKSIDGELERCFLTIGSLIAHLKHDLGEVEVSNLRYVASARHAVDDIMRAGLT